jgi:hypothetical protein
MNPKLDDFESEMNIPVQQYSEKDINDIPRIFTKEEVKIPESTDTIKEMELEEEIPKQNPRKAKITAKMTFFTIDTAVQTILSILAKSEIPGANDKEKSDLIEMWEEYYLESGKEPPLWLMLVGMNVAVYGDKVGMAIQKRKEGNSDNEEKIVEEEIPSFEMEIKTRKMRKDPIMMPMKEVNEEKGIIAEQEKKEELIQEKKEDIDDEKKNELNSIRNGIQEENQSAILICKNENCENELKGKQKSFCSIKCKNEYINTKKSKR